MQNKCANKTEMDLHVQKTNRWLPVGRDWRTVHPKAVSKVIFFHIFLST